MLRASPPSIPPPLPSFQFPALASCHKVINHPCTDAMSIKLRRCVVQKIDTYCSVPALTALHCRLSSCFTMTMKRKNLSIEFEMKRKLLADVDKKLLLKKGIAAKYGIPHNTLSTIGPSQKQRKDRKPDFKRPAARAQKTAEVCQCQCR